jgi:hypothetical protein
MTARIYALGAGHLNARALVALASVTLACGTKATSDGSTGGGGGGGATSDSGGNVDAGGGSGGRGVDSAAPMDADAGRCDEIVNAAPASHDLEPIEPGVARNWWVVTSAGRVDGSVATFVPPASPPAPSATVMDGRAFLQMTGSGLGPLDYGVLGYSPQASILGGEPTDLSDGPGISFDAKGHHFWVVINTVDTVPRFCKCSGDDCFAGYRYEVPVTPNWATYTVTWDQFALPSYVAHRPSLDAMDIISISFGGINGDFDVSVDNVRIADVPNMDAGEGGQ